MFDSNNALDLSEVAKAMRLRAQHGFSLIELMIAVAIIGVLAAAAIPAYRSYVESSNMTKVSTHYRQGVRFIESEFRRLRTEIAIGTLDAVQADADYTNAAWIQALNGEGGKAPDGTDAYAASASDAGGVVGVSTTGTFATHDVVVTLTRPQYGDFAAVETRSIAWADV